MEKLWERRKLQLMMLLFMMIWAFFIISFIHYIPLSCSPWLTNLLSFPKNRPFYSFGLWFVPYRLPVSARLRIQTFFIFLCKLCVKNTYLVISIRKQDLDKKAEILWLYQHKIHSSLFSIHNCKMVYWIRLSYNGSLIVCVLFFVSSGSAGYQYSTNTFLYSLKNYYGYGYFKQDIISRYYSDATYSRYDYGPTFGGGHDMHIADHAGGNTNSYFNCNSYPNPYCDNYLWVGSRYGNSFRPDELEVYYEVLAWNRARKQKTDKQTNSTNNHNKNINKPTKINNSKKMTMIISSPPFTIPFSERKLPSLSWYFQGSATHDKKED